MRLLMSFAHHIRNAELVEKVQLNEHSHCGQAGLLVGKYEIIKLKVIDVVHFCALNLSVLQHSVNQEMANWQCKRELYHELDSLFNSRRCMVGKHFKGHLLSSIKFNCLFVHHAVVNAESAENGKPLQESCAIRVVLCSVVCLAVRPRESQCPLR